MVMFVLGRVFLVLAGLVSAAAGTLAAADDQRSGDCQNAAQGDSQKEPLRCVSCCMSL
jgi:hypothetical protein